MSKPFAVMLMIMTLLGTMGTRPTAAEMGGLLSVTAVSANSTLRDGVWSHTHSHGPLDCDEESCPDHHCHLGHCPFSLPPGIMVALSVDPPWQDLGFGDPRTMRSAWHVPPLLDPPRMFT